MNKTKKFEARIKQFDKYQKFVDSHKELFEGITIPEVTLKTTDAEYDNMISIVSKEYNKNKYWIERIPEGEEKERFLTNLLDRSVNGYAGLIGLGSYFNLTSKSFQDMVLGAFDWHEGKEFKNEEVRSFWEKFSKMEID